MNPKDCSLQQFFEFRLKNARMNPIPREYLGLLGHSEESMSASEFFGIEVTTSFAHDELCSIVIEYLTGAGYDVEILDQPVPSPEQMEMMNRVADSFGIPKTDRFPYSQTFKAIRDDTITIIHISYNDTRASINQYPPQPYKVPD